MDWALIAVLGAALFFVFEPVYLKLAFSDPKKKAVSLVFKSLATATALSLTVIGYLRNPDTFGLLMVFAMSVCLIGDILIGINFVAGVLAFLLGQLFYLPAFLQTYPFHWFISVPVFLAGLSLVWILFHNYFKKAGNTLAPCLLYSVVLNAMLSIGVPAFLSHDIRGILITAGALLFTTSDLTLAGNVYVKRTHTSDTVSLTFYFAAQFLLGLSVFVPAAAL